MAKQKTITISEDLILLLLLASLMPVFRCGLRDNLNFWQWIGEHTIWGSPVQYVPEEEYENIET